MVACLLATALPAQRSSDAAPEISRGLEKEAARVVMVPVPPVDYGLVQAAAERLAERLTIPVEVRSVDFRLPPRPSRGEMDEVVEKHRALFEKCASKEHVDALLKRHGLEPDRLLENHIFVAVYRPWLVRMALWQNLRLFDREVTAKRRPQCDGAKLGDYFNRKIGSMRRQQDFTFAITAGDIYGGDLRYSFAASGGRSSVISYSRFLPWFTGEDPDWEKLVSRLHKQAMCSIGRCSGVLECADVGCPCTYADGLESHDAKTEDFCAHCRDKISVARRR